MIAVNVCNLWRPFFTEWKCAKSSAKNNIHPALAKYENVKNVEGTKKKYKWKRITLKLGLNMFGVPKLCFLVQCVRIGCHRYQIEVKTSKKTNCVINTLIFRGNDTWISLLYNSNVTVHGQFFKKDNNTVCLGDR